MKYFTSLLFLLCFALPLSAQVDEWGVEYEQEPIDDEDGSGGTTVQQAACQDDYSRPGGPCFEIPVVFHVAYLPGATPGSIGRPGQTQLLGLLQQLNGDFRGSNSDVTDVIEEYCPLVGDAKMNFKFDRIVEAEDTEGPKNWGNAGYFQLLSPQPSGTENYLHIWVVTFSGMQSGNLGMECPLNGSFTFGCDVDGIVIDGRSIADQTRTASHEIGHWMGLKHVFEAPPHYYDDDIADTPCQANISINCEDLYQPITNGNLCMSDNDIPYINAQNFMQITGSDTDDCRRMFTHGQCSFMRSTMENYRPMLEVVNVQYCDYTMTDGKGKGGGSSTSALRAGQPGIVNNTNYNSTFNKVIFWPNPVSNNLWVKGNGIVQVKIIDVNGRSLISENNSEEHEIEVDISSLTNGLYIILFEMENGEVKQDRLIKH